VALDTTSKQAQRLWPRWFIAGTKPVKVDLGPAGAGPLVDISGGGLRVQSLAPLRRGAEVPVRIDIPERAEPLQCSGVVVWSKPNGAAGIRFANLSEAQKTILQGWLSELESAATNPSQVQVQDDFTSVVSQIRGAQLNNGDALNMIVRRARELSSVSGAAIALGTPENMVCMAGAGEAPAVGSTVPAVIGLAGECVFKRKMIHCEDTKNDPRVGRESSFGSAVILPLIVNGEVRGLFEVFSKRAYAFTSASIDTLEKLADAVIFVTHGIVTQRRLATTKPSLSAGSTGLGPKPSTPLTPASAAFTPPLPIESRSHAEMNTAPTLGATRDFIPASNPVHLSSNTALASPLRAQSSSVETVPLASSIAVPGTGMPKRAKSKWDARSNTASVRYSPRQEDRRSKRSSAGKWVGVAAVVLVISVIPAWYLVKQQRPVSVAEEEPTAASMTGSPIEVKSDTVSVSVPAVRTTMPAVTKAPPVKSAPVIAPTHEDKAVEVEPKPHPSAPEPIILAANTPKAPRPLDLETVVPVKLPSALPETGAVSQIALPATSKAAPSLAVTVPDVRTEGTLIKKVAPVYPPMARSAGMQGTVELHLHITPQGTVDVVRRLSGQPMLANAAIEAVKQWRYDPAKLNGKPVEMETTVRLVFSVGR
jgi:TonB family protein